MKTGVIKEDNGVILVCGKIWITFVKNKRKKYRYNKSFNEIQNKNLFQIQTFYSMIRLY